MEDFKYDVVAENTPENRAWLETLGYKPFMARCGDKLYSVGFDISMPNTFTSNLMIEESAISDFIDCTNNNELFKAVTAIRDDSDYMQWFVIDRINGATDEYVSDWRICQSIQFDIESVPLYGITNHHKATLEELQEHFKI